MSSIKHTATDLQFFCCPQASGDDRRGDQEHQVTHVTAIDCDDVAGGCEFSQNKKGMLTAELSS